MWEKKNIQIPQIYNVLIRLKYVHWNALAAHTAIVVLIEIHKLPI